MNVRVLSALLVVLAGASVAACGGGTTGGGSTPVPCPLYALPAPPQMLYPIPGASGVPDGNFTLVVAYGSTPPPLQLVVAGGSIPAFSSNVWGPPPSPMPSPAATPRSSTDNLYGLAVPALSAQTTYTAQVTFGSPPCQSTETAGSFTTQ